MAQKLGACPVCGRIAVVSDETYAYYVSGFIIDLDCKDCGYGWFLDPTGERREIPVSKD